MQSWLPVSKKSRGGVNAMGSLGGSLGGDGESGEGSQGPPSDSSQARPCSGWARWRWHHRRKFHRGYEAEMLPRAPKEAPKDASGKWGRVLSRCEARCAASKLELKRVRCTDRERQM